MGAAVLGCLLLVVSLSVWAVVSVGLLHSANLNVAQSGAYDNCPWCTSAFGSVADASLTLMRHVVVGDGWGDVMLVLIREQPWTAVVFFFAFASINLALLSLIVAVMTVPVQQQSLGQDVKPVE